MVYTGPDYLFQWLYLVANTDPQGTTLESILLENQPDTWIASERTWLVAENVSAVPLPAAAWLFLSALIGLPALRRWQRG
jgi:hypothetical protein